MNERRNFTVKGGWVIDGSGEPFRENAVFKVENGVIHFIDPARLDPSPFPEIQDLSDYTILPGLVDSHAHLVMSGTDDPEIRRWQLNAGYESIRAVIAKHLDALSSFGIIAVRDGGDHYGHTLRYKLETGAACPIVIAAAGRAWHAENRYGKLIGRFPKHGRPLQDAIECDSGVIDHVKIVQSGLNSLTEFGKETPPQFRADELRTGVETAHQMGLKVMIHANGRIPVQTAIESGCDSIEHGFFMGLDNLKRMAEKGITWVPTAVTMKAYAETARDNKKQKEVARRNLDHQLEQMRFAQSAGVTLALGSDSGSLGVHHGSSLVEEFKLFLDAGFTIEQTVSCASKNGGDLITSAPSGLIQNGETASFIAVKGHPDTLPDSFGSIRFRSGHRSGAVFS